MAENNEAIDELGGGTSPGSMDYEEGNRLLDFEHDAVLPGPVPIPPVQDGADAAPGAMEPTAQAVPQPGAPLPVTQAATVRQRCGQRFRQPAFPALPPKPRRKKKRKKNLAQKRGRTPAAVAAAVIATVAALLAPPHPAPALVPAPK